MTPQQRKATKRRKLRKRYLKLKHRFPVGRRRKKLNHGGKPRPTYLDLQPASRKSRPKKSDRNPIHEQEAQTSFREEKPSG